MQKNKKYIHYLSVSLAVQDMAVQGAKLFTLYYAGTQEQSWKEQVVKECFYFPGAWVVVS